MVIFCVIIIVLVMTSVGNVVLLIKETMEPESSRTCKSLQLLTMFIVSVVHIVTRDSFFDKTIFDP